MSAQVQPGQAATTPATETERWRQRAVWAENRLAEIERELVMVGRRRFGCNQVWRWRALLPVTWRAIERARDRESERTLRRDRARRRRAR